MRTPPIFRVSKKVALPQQPYFGRKTSNTRIAEELFSEKNNGEARRKERLNSSHRGHTLHAHATDRVSIKK
jgi:hypothetical protein